MSHFLKKTQENKNFRENYKSKTIFEVAKNPRRPGKSCTAYPSTAYIKNFERTFKK